LIARTITPRGARYASFFAYGCRGGFYRVCHYRFAPLGCGSRLGPVRANQNGGGIDHPDLPDITVERAKECVAEYGPQLEPGRHAFNSNIEVNEDGDKLDVTIEDVPDTAPDFGACMRNVLRDMPIAEEPLRQGVETLKYRREQASAAQRSLVSSPVVVVVGVTVVVSELVLEAGAYTILFAVAVQVVDKAAKDVADLAKKASGSTSASRIILRAWRPPWVTHLGETIGRRQDAIRASTDARRTNHGQQTLVTGLANIGKKVGDRNRSIFMSLKSHPEEVAFTDEISQVTLRLMELTFEEAVREYRRIETKFVARAESDEEDVRDIQRRVTAKILGAARGNEQPHEVCRAIWEELVQRGFSDREQKSIFTGIYARCCQMNGEFDAGLAVLEPLIAESEQWLEHAILTPELRAYWEHDLAIDYKIRDELKAGLRE